MSQGSKPRAYKLPCGCVVQVRAGTEVILEMCACCDSEWSERRTRAAADYHRIRNPAPSDAVPA